MIWSAAAASSPVCFSTTNNRASITLSRAATYVSKLTGAPCLAAPYRVLVRRATPVNPWATTWRSLVTESAMDAGPSGLANGAAPEQVDDAQQHHRAEQRDHQPGQAEVTLIDRARAEHRCEQE